MMCRDSLLARLINGQSVQTAEGGVTDNVDGRSPEELTARLPEHPMLLEAAVRLCHDLAVQGVGTPLQQKLLLVLVCPHRALSGRQCPRLHHGQERGFANMSKRRWHGGWDVVFEDPGRLEVLLLDVRRSSGLLGRLRAWPFSCSARLGSGIRIGSVEASGVLDFVVELTCGGGLACCRLDLLCCGASRRLATGPLSFGRHGTGERQQSLLVRRAGSFVVVESSRILHGS